MAEKQLWVALTGPDDKIEVQVPVPKGREVTVGSDSDCALPIAGRDAPARKLVLVPDGDRHALRFEPGMALKVKLGDGRIFDDAQALAGSGAAEKMGDFFQLRLDEECRGYVEVAGRKVIFKFGDGE